MSRDENRMSRTAAEVEALVLADYAKVHGQVCYVSWISAYREPSHPDPREVNDDMDLDPPILARIFNGNFLNHEVRDGLLHWTDDVHCDPYYDVYPLNPDDERIKHYRNPWTNGPTRSTDGTDNGGAQLYVVLAPPDIAAEAMAKALAAGVYVGPPD